MLGPVWSHEFFHRLQKLLFVLRHFHIDEIHHDNATDISKTKLTRNFISSFQVRFHRILLLVVAYAFVSAVYVNHVERFSMFYDQVSATIEIYSFSKTAFNLFSNSELVEDWCAILMKRNDIGLLRCNPLNITFSIGEDAFVICNNAVEIFIQKIAEYACCLCLLAENFCWSNSTTKVLLDTIPHSCQLRKILVQF